MIGYIKSPFDIDQLVALQACFAMSRSSRREPFRAMNIGPNLFLIEAWARHVVEISERKMARGTV